MAQARALPRAARTRSGATVENALRREGGRERSGEKERELRERDETKGRARRALKRRFFGAPSKRPLPLFTH